MMASMDQFPPGTPVTLAWYEPGEPHRPTGQIVEPDHEDLARLDGADPAGRVLVHWRPGNWRRWESIEDIHQDEPGQE